MTGFIDDNQRHILEEAMQQFIEAQLQGEEPDIDDFLKRYPEFEDQLRKRILKLRKIDTLFASIMQPDDSDCEETVTRQFFSGRKLGRFEISEVIGQGGMGVVYLARDTKLDRSVAIKSMPIELWSDSTAEVRFRREAKLLASLNHSNIAVIHEIIEQDDGSVYLVLEYVPGRTLTEHIANKPLKLQDALSIGQQIAEALFGAYEHGVIHRDLKPSNIKITPDGKVKVLDFGLAKTSGLGNESLNSTITQLGHVIGTPAYMSPEQARGCRTNHQTDIWSFGCIMYEMLTGHHPFEGKTISDTIACILEHEPDWDALPTQTPVNIRVLIRRCLEKELPHRLQHIGDAVIEIRETINMPAAEPPTTIPTRRITAGKRQNLVAISLLCLLVISVTIFIKPWNRDTNSSSQSTAVRSYVINPDTSLAMEALWHHALAFSPDGTRLAYVEQGDDRRRKICVRRMNELSAKPLAGTEGAVSPFFSPEGKWIGYADHFHKQLKKVSSEGSNPMVLASCPEFRGGTWTEDDRIIFCPEDKGGLWSISSTGENLRQLTSPKANEDERGHWWPQILPDGKTLLFTTAQTEKLDQYQIEIYSMETGQRYVLFKGGHYARYISTGHLLYARRESLYAVRFDLDKLKVAGDHIQVKSDVASSLSRSSQFAYAEDGSLAYIPAMARNTELKPVWVNKEGMIQLLGVIPRNYHSVRISPDGTSVAFSIIEGDNQDIWICDLSNQMLHPLTSDGEGIWPVWFSDSQRVVYSSQGDLLWQRVDGSTKPKLIHSENTGAPMCCSPDGKELLVVMGDPNDPKHGDDIGVVHLEEFEKDSPTPFIQRNHHQRNGCWSPDGQWVAYSSEEIGSWEVYVEPYPGLGPKIQISTQGGIQPVWSRDGKELYYRSGNKIMAVSVDVGSELKVLDSKVLFEGSYLYCLNCQTYDVAPDGRFLMIQDPLEHAPSRINVILNWDEELKRLVSTTRK